MIRLRTSIRNHPVPSYVILTFVLSWGTMLAMIVSAGMPATMEEANAQLPVAIVAMLLGPFVSGLLLTGLVHGRSGYRTLLTRLGAWRSPIRWYAAAILTGPLVLVAVQALLVQLSPAYIPGIFSSDDAPMLILMGVVGGLMVGICEEAGWTGFAVPLLRTQRSVLATGLIVGIVWGAWHILSNDVWVIRTYAGELPPAIYAILRGLGFLIGQLVPFRVLMVWVYDRTESLLLIVLMHASLTAATLILSPAAMAGTSVLWYDAALAAAMWIVAAAVIASRRDQFMQLRGKQSA